jgi:HK97 family phage major capsid protein
MSLALFEARQRIVEEMKGLSDKETLTEAEDQRFEELEAELRKADKALDRAEAVAEAAKRTAPEVAAQADQDALRAAARPASASVEAVRAVSPYEAENRGASWFQDRAAIANPEASNAEVDEARARLAAHYDAVGDEAGGRHVRTYSAGTTTEGGYLVAPQYLQSAFADLLSAGRPTADLVGKMGLPASGKTFYIPTQDGATAVGVATENSALTETTATFSQIQVDAARVGGTATMPNWLVDRSFPGADQIVLRDLAKKYAQYINTIVLNSSTSNRKGLLQETGLGAATATATTPTVATYWPALLNAINDVASGVFAYPDAIVMHPRRWAHMASLLDGSRPVIGSLAPQNGVAAFSGINVPGQGQGPQAVGGILGIPVYLDAGIPTTADTDQDRIIVMKRDEPLLMESTPKFAVSTDAEFAKDQLVARVTGDVAFTCARRKAAVSIISGTALAATI